MGAQHAVMLEEKKRKAEEDKAWEAKNSWKNDKKEEKKEEKKDEDGEKKEGDEEKKDEEMEDAEEAKEEEIKLSEEELKTFFRKKPLPDLLENTISEMFANFGIPTSDESFDEIKYAWEGEHGCAEYLKKWKLERKKTLPVKDLAPSEWFQSKYSEWQRSMEDLKKRQKEFKRE